MTETLNDTHIRAHIRIRVHLMLKRTHTLDCIMTRHATRVLDMRIHVFLLRNMSLLLAFL